MIRKARWRRCVRSRATIVAQGLSLAPIATLLVLSLALALAPGAQAFNYRANDGAIGRANLDGTNPNPGFISRASSLGSVAIDADHVYWAVGPDSTNCCDIACANLDGTAVDKNFVSGAGGEIAQVGAVDPNHIHWSRNCCRPRSCG